MTAPITHPLFGVDPNQNLVPNNTGYMDPSKPPLYQGAPPMAGNMMTAPPPNAITNNPMIGGGDYLNPHSNVGVQGQAPMQTTFQSMAMNYQNTTAAGMMKTNNSNLQQNAQTWNPGASPAPPTINNNSANTIVPKTKPPLPEEYSYLHTVLEELKTQCLNKTTDPVSIQ